VGDIRTEIFGAAVFTGQLREMWLPENGGSLEANPGHSRTRLSDPVGVEKVFVNAH
jgi:hypothetical protein